MPTRSIVTPQDVQAISKLITGLSLPFTLTWRGGVVRTLSQNALLHKWYGEIAAEQGDSADAVKGRCHMQYGLPIKMRDAQFAFVWSNATAKLSYEQKCKVMSSGIFAVTSTMTTKELTEYMDAMRRDYLAQGVRLTDPDDLKYKNA